MASWGPTRLLPTEVLLANGIEQSQTRFKQMMSTGQPVLLTFINGYIGSEVDEVALSQHKLCSTQQYKLPSE